MATSLSNVEEEVVVVLCFLNNLNGLLSIQFKLNLKLLSLTSKFKNKASSCDAAPEGDYYINK